jgi:hypothetical protein
MSERRRYTSLKIKELSSVDDPAQKGAMAMVMKRHQGVGLAGEQFAAKVAEIQKRDACKASEALERARLEHPDLFDAFQSAPGAVASAQKREPSAEEVATLKAGEAFMDRARDIAKRDSLPLHAGMERARIEAPGLHAAWA